MSDTMTQALHNATASSAMEGPLELKHMNVIQDILDGKMTLQEFFRQLQSGSCQAMIAEVADNI